MKKYVKFVISNKIIHICSDNRTKQKNVLQVQTEDLLVIQHVTNYVGQRDMTPKYTASPSYKTAIHHLLEDQSS